MRITCVGRASSTQVKRSSSIPVACFEYTLKFAPSRERVAPRGELRPSLVSCATSDVRSGILSDLSIILDQIRNLKFEVRKLECWRNGMLRWGTAPALFHHFTIV